MENANHLDTVFDYIFVCFVLSCATLLSYPVYNIRYAQVKIIQHLGPISSIKFVRYILNCAYVVF